MELAEQIAMAALVLLLLCGTLWALRRRGTVSFTLPGVSPGKERRMQVMERLSLTPTHSLHLVKVADRILLIGVAPNACVLLEGTNGSFAASIESAMGRNR